MLEHPSLDALDGQDAAAHPRMPRARFLKRSAALAASLGLGGGAVGALSSLSSAAPPSAGMDLRILNFLLRLEYVQAAFYARASEEGALSGELADLARIVGEHEQAHVAYLQELLGDDAIEEPSFDFGDAVSGEDAFTEAALELEETAAAAYIGQGANLTQDKILAAARIVSVEARHAAWIRDIVGKKPAPSAQDAALSEKKVTAAIEATGFIR
jgi:Ferritin-like domain